MSKLLLPSKRIIRSPYVKKFRELMGMPMSGHVGMGGDFRLECVKADGRSFWMTPWFHNNITNVGLDMCATTSTRLGCCQVGSGTSAPQDTDTTMQSYVAGTFTRTDINNGSLFIAGPPPYLEAYVRYDFALDAVVGNISEVGVGPSQLTGQNLFSRELIRDAAGAPTTITLPINSQLRIHYKFRHYPPTVDAVGSVNGTLYGGASSRGFTRRAALINNNGQGINTTWGVGKIGQNNNDQHVFNFQQANRPGNYLAIFTGSLGATTGVPAGQVMTATSMVADSYSAGSFQRSATVEYVHTEVAASVKSATICARIGTNSSGQYPMYSFAPFQIEFDTPIEKGPNDTLTFGVNYSWGRYVP